MNKKLLLDEKRLFIFISITIVILPILFFSAINLFHMTGLPVYFAQLGLYAIIFLLSFWGIKTNGIRLPVSLHSILDAFFVLLLAWTVYVVFLSFTGISNFSSAIGQLKITPAWKVLAQILSTWIFVGIGEELLFRGYILNHLYQTFVKWGNRRRTLFAILFSSIFFSLWHLPVRIYELIMGESSVWLILLSVMVLFIMAMGFAWLFIRTNNILLVGLMHGVMDYPLIGEDSQMSFIILIAAIVCVELFRRRKQKEPDEDEF